MTCKCLIAVASGEPEDASVLAVAARVSARLGARLRVLPAFADPAADLVYFGAALKHDVGQEAAERIAASEGEILARLRDQASAAARAENVPDDMLVVEARDLRPASALARAAVLSDLVLFGHGAAHGALEGMFVEALVSSRAPCLLIKSGEYRFGPAAVAWDGSAQAGRAVRAALPLLQAASRILVLRNAEDRDLRGDASDSADLIAYLRMHGGTEVADRQLKGERVADSLLEAARTENCDLLVAGAYGRPRLYELALGGTTRALADASEPPHVLLSH